jgi:hypothetical protein
MDGPLYFRELSRFPGPLARRTQILTASGSKLPGAHDNRPRRRGGDLDTSKFEPAAPMRYKTALPVTNTLQPFAAAPMPIASILP